MLGRAAALGCTRQRVLSIALGQVLAVLITCTGVFSTFLSSAGVHTPTAQSTLNYFLLILYLGVKARKHGVRNVAKLKVAWWRYFLCAAVDVEANFLVVYAYAYTHITSIMLIDCWTIPCVMFLSWRFMGAKFTRRHVLGVVLCIGGLGVLAGSDYLTSKDDGAEDAPNPLLGDLLCVGAATLYAISNVAQEILVKAHDKNEFLGMLGLFGFLINGVQAGVLEHSEIASAVFDGPAVGYLIGFALSLFAMYSLTAIFLQKADSTLFNLSLLASDLWAVVVSVFMFHQPVHPLYFLSLAIIVVGLVAYNSAPEPTNEYGTCGANATPAAAKTGSAAGDDEEETPRVDGDTRSLIAPRREGSADLRPLSAPMTYQIP